MAGEQPFSGVYINLDRSDERRRSFEQQLRDLNFESYYERFPAVDGRTVNLPRSTLKPGEAGAFMSHCRALEQAGQKAKCVHVVEDDVLLSERVVPVIQDALGAGFFDRYDLMFTDMTVHCHVGFMKRIKNEYDRIMSTPMNLRQFRTIDLEKTFHAAFQSYVVGAKSIARVVSLYKQELQSGPRIPVDIFIQQQVLAGRLRAACLFPFITSVRLENVVNSTIEGHGKGVQHASIIVMAVLRYLFFVDCDLAYARKILDEATGHNRKAMDMRLALMVQATEFVMSDDFVG